MSEPNRFRFRAWCDMCSTMREPWQITESMMQGVLTASCDNHDCYTQVSLMQSTGLCDSAGQEIFEGDVVELWHEEMFFADDVRAVIEWCRINVCFEVGYLKHKLLVGSRALSSLDMDYAAMKVIGNIHQNKEQINED